ncbi:acyl carrier protein [Actinosynnema sp. NPDC020468]|uniref:acyl carrier protein n=1 Tax=Actinosynnema sp. NPDC020468 TaxID=3154488 RepID=UPI0033CCA365
MSADFEAVVAGVLEVAPAEVTDDATQDTLPSWTSMRHIQLVVTLEEAFGLAFDYGEIRDTRSVGALRGLLRAKGVLV